MSTTNRDLGELIADNRERIYLVIYFSIILGCAVPLSQMLGEAYISGNLTQSILRLRLLAGISLEVMSIAIFGIYLGLLLLLVLDPKKRLQGTLLVLGTILGLVGLQSQGLFLPNVDLIANLPILAIGILIGVVLGGGRTLLNLRETRELEFRQAAATLFVLLAGFTIIGFLELHINYPDFITVNSTGIQLNSISNAALSINGDGLLVNAVVSGVFIATTRQFIQYDAEQKFFILGPRGSGKSLFLIGTFLAANRRRSSGSRATPLRPSQDLMEMIERLDDERNDWIVEATGRSEVRNLNFTFTKGSLFPKNMEISSMDYAGENLRRLPDALVGALDQGEMDTTMLRLRDGVNEADTLVFILDVERFISDEQTLDISDYFPIIEVKDDATIIVVATKADYLAKEFEDETGLRAYKNYREFKQYVNDRLRQSENVNVLVRESGSTEIHPVHYQTRETDEGEIVPMRDNGSPMTVGFEEFLEEIEKI